MPRRRARWRWRSPPGAAAVRCPLVSRQILPFSGPDYPLHECRLQSLDVVDDCRALRWSLVADNDGGGAQLPRLCEAMAAAMMQFEQRLPCRDGIARLREDAQ